jgi:coenzyme PQQ biosynthesis protein C
VSLLSPEALEAALNAIGQERYHILHPFHDLLHGGRLTKGQIQAWALNRYYYQASIPAKDASLLARLPTPDLRREWRRRLEDHDGDGTHPGGVERWLALTDALGLDRDYVVSLRGLLPATRFAVDAYVAFVREPFFGLMIPESAPGIPANVLNPRDAWADKDAYDRQAAELVARFEKNFETFVGAVGEDVKAVAIRAAA